MQKFEQLAEVEPGWRQGPRRYPEGDPEDGEREDLGDGDTTPEGEAIPVDEVIEGFNSAFQALPIEVQLMGLAAATAAVGVGVKAVAR